MNKNMAHPGIGFVAASKLYFKRYADFSGRSSRSEYWWASLLSTLILLLAVVLVLPASDAYGRDPESGNVFMSLAMGFLGLAYLGLIMPCIAVSLRRIRDAGFHPAFYLLGLVPLGSFAVLYFVLQPSSPNTIEGIPSAEQPQMGAYTSGYGAVGNPMQPGNPHYGQSPYTTQPGNVGQQAQAQFGQQPQAPYGQQPQAQPGNSANGPTPTHFAD